MTTFVLPGGESASAALRRAEADRDAAKRESEAAWKAVERLRDNEKRWAAELERAEAELASVRESLDARTRALVRARALNGALIAEVDRLGEVAYGTTLCRRCGEELAAEVAAENAGETP